MHLWNGERMWTDHETKYERERDLEVLALELSKMTDEERFRVRSPEPFVSFSTGKRFQKRFIESGGKVDKPDN